MGRSLLPSQPLLSSWGAAAGEKPAHRLGTLLGASEGPEPPQCAHPAGPQGATVTRVADVRGVLTLCQVL